MVTDDVLSPSLLSALPPLETVCQRGCGITPWSVLDRRLPGEILTDVSATVAPHRESDLLMGYRELIAQPVPEGLVRTELLGGRDGHRAALDAMRSAPEPPAAPFLFRQVGADPVLAVFESWRAWVRIRSPESG
jgi:hypothetical protein